MLILNHIIFFKCIKFMATKKPQQQEEISPEGTETNYTTGDRSLEKWEIMAWEASARQSQNPDTADEAADDAETAEKLAKMAEEAAAQVREMAAVSRSLLEKNNS